MDNADTNNTTIPTLLTPYCTEITSSYEETFDLFSTYANAAPLGMLSPSTPTVEVSVGERDFVFSQSRGLLESNRSGGTTGAVLWQLQPHLTTWLSSPSNFLHTTLLLNRNTILFELGVGISPLTALCLSPKIAQYILSDQDYVLKLLRQNLRENQPKAVNIKGKGRGGKRGMRNVESGDVGGNIEVVELDWETTDISSLLSQSSSISTNPLLQPTILLATDCIYNPSILPSFISTLHTLSSLPPPDYTTENTPVLSIIAQQLRSPDVFEEWLEGMMSRGFRVWRVDEGALRIGKVGDERREDVELSVQKGFVVHICMLG